MAFNLDGFTGTIGKYGLASPNKFEVAIFGPGKISSGNEINLMCESVSIAGRNVQSIMDLRYGQRREIAYNAPVYAPVNLTFLCTEKYREKDYFDRWKGNLLISFLVAESLVRIIFDDKKDSVIYYENINIGNRIRDIIQSPDGKIVLLTDRFSKENVPELIFLTKEK